MSNSLTNDEQNIKKIYPNLRAIDDTHIFISGTSSMFTFNQNYDSLWQLITDTTKINSIISKIFPFLYSKPIQITKNPPGLVFSEFELEIKENNKIIKLFFNLIDSVELDYYSSVTWRISQEENLNNILTNNNNTDCLEEDKGKKNKKQIIKLNLHKIAYKKTLFSILSTDLIIYKQLIGIENIENQNTQKNFNLFFTTIDKNLGKFWKIQSQIETKLFNSDFQATSLIFSSPQICTSMIGTITSKNDDKLRKGSFIKFKNKDNKELIIQTRKFYLTKKAFLSKFWIYDGNSNNGFPCREMKVELFNVNKGETFVIITHKFNKILSREELTNLSNLKKVFLNKLGKVIEKSYKKICSQENNSHSS